ncbi:hypothetical protein [Hymenobacter cellulosilyticus]|uniref:Uncharacterized protein n=1 Tax=Hymenobacter cellulosilyticus TaxID=2932248 RepID=A0A8T9Q3D9_9BACT|nr:hypothetical protein [Hymenobacter cellulosilyticus]UOQ70971.1 hypothetical protein MUN79_20170 [Hymenobacter cellulosilyticus]
MRNNIAEQYWMLFLYAGVNDISRARFDPNTPRDSQDIINDFISYGQLVNGDNGRFIVATVAPAYASPADASYQVSLSNEQNRVVVNNFLLSDAGKAAIGAVDVIPLSKNRLIGTYEGVQNQALYPDDLHGNAAEQTLLAFIFSEAIILASNQPVGPLATPLVSTVIADR